MSAEAWTTFGGPASATASAQVLSGQNSDVEPRLKAFAYLLPLEPVGKPVVLMETFGGQIGNHGIHAAGVAHFANSLAGGPCLKFGRPHSPSKRLMLEQRTVGEVRPGPLSDILESLSAECQDMPVRRSLLRPLPHYFPILTAANVALSRRTTSGCLSSRFLRSSGSSVSR